MSGSQYWWVMILGGLSLLVVLDTLGNGVERDDVVPVGVFSEMDPSQPLPKGWHIVSLAATFEKTAYALVPGKQGSVVRARSHGENASLATKHRVDLHAHPILEWRWKVSTTIQKARADDKLRDDSPARSFVSFDYDELPLTQRLKHVAMRVLGYEAVPRRAIAYFWANEEQPLVVLDNTRAEWIQMVPVRNRTAPTGTWLSERRNVLSDYRQIFGEDPPPVKRVAFMADTENTETKVTAFYGDIVFRASPSVSTIADSTLHVRSGD